jgi:hypothetical protein
MQEICHITFVNYETEANQVNIGVLPILAGVGRGEEGVNCTVLERSGHYELIQPDLVWLLSCDLLDSGCCYRLNVLKKYCHRQAVLRIRIRWIRMFWSSWIRIRIH